MRNAAEWLTVAELQRDGILRVEDGNHGEYRPRPDEFGSGITAFIRASDMDAGRVLFDSASKINDVALRRIQKGHGKPGDILFSSKGTVGKLARAPMESPPFVCSPQTTYWRVLDTNRLSRGFLYTFMRSRGFRDQWEAIKGETDMADYASLTAQRRFRVPLPGIEFQRWVESHITALDDKIELNRRMNRTLEELAGALFRAWFVDFEPVVAKAAGRAPFGISPAIAALFPSNFTDSEVGPIPHGWKAGPIKQLYRATFDGPHATPPDSDSGPVFLGIKNLTGTRIELKDARYISEADYPRWTKRVTPNHLDIVFTYEATIGFCALMPPDLRCCLGRRLALVRAHAGTEHFLFHSMVAAPFQELLAARVWSGSTVDRIPLTEFPDYPILWPGEALAKAFDAAVKPWWRMIHHNQTESRTLAALRDTLLPKLLSGELRVKDAAKRAEVTA